MAKDKHAVPATDPAFREELSLTPPAAPSTDSDAKIPGYVSSLVGSLIVTVSSMLTGCSLLFEVPTNDLPGADAARGQDDSARAADAMDPSTMHLRGNLLELSFTGGGIVDTSGQGLVVSPFGGPVTEAGYFGEGIRFLGTSAHSRLNVTYAQQLSGLSGLTVEAWVNFESSNFLGPIFGNLNSAAGDPVEHAVGINSAGVPTYRTRQGESGTFDLVQAAQSLPVGDWAHVAVTVDYPTVAFYIDGALITQNNTIATPPAATPRDYTIGSYGGSGEFGGLMDEIKVSDYAKSRSQIQASMLYAPAP